MAWKGISGSSSATPATHRDTSHLPGCSSLALDNSRDPGTAAAPLGILSPHPPSQEFLLIPVFPLGSRPYGSCPAPPRPGSPSGEEEEVHQAQDDGGQQPAILEELGKKGKRREQHSASGTRINPASVESSSGASQPNPAPRGVQGDSAVRRQHSKGGFFGILGFSVARGGSSSPSG